MNVKYDSLVGQSQQCRSWFRGTRSNDCGNDFTLARNSKAVTSSGTIQMDSRFAVRVCMLYNDGVLKRSTVKKMLFVAWRSLNCEL